MDWIIETKAWEWLFSGIGVVILAGIARWIWNRKSKEAVSSDPPSGETVKPAKEGDDIRIHAGGDVAIAKDKGRAVQVKNSRVGVIGDNAKVNGGINFTTNSKPDSGNKS